MIRDAGGAASLPQLSDSPESAAAAIGLIRPIGPMPSGEGLVSGLSWADYDQRPGLDASLLKTVDGRSLAHARALLDAPESVAAGGEDDPLHRHEFRAAFLALLFTGRVEYSVQPATYGDERKPWNRRARLCQEWEAEQRGRAIFTEREARRLEAMVVAARVALEDVDLTNGEWALSAFARYDDQPVKCRADFVPSNPRAPVLAFTWCASAEPGEFLRQAMRRREHLHAAWTLDVLRWAGRPRAALWLVGIEPRPPYATGILKFEDKPLSFLRVGRRACRAGLARLADAAATERWPDYGRAAAEDHAAPWMLQALKQTA